MSRTRMVMRWVTVCEHMLVNTTFIENGWTLKRACGIPSLNAILYINVGISEASTQTHMYS